MAVSLQRNLLIQLQKMKKILFIVMLAASVSVITCCTADDMFEDSYNYDNG